jgi:hypothetical protein
MATETISQMPLALALDGTERLCISQTGNQAVPWVTKAATTAQIVALVAGAVGPSICTMRQLFAALASLNLLTTAFEALSSDITDPYNIAWNHAGTMTITDAFITTFLEPVLSYNDSQIIALFALAQTFPK